LHDPPGNAPDLREKFAEGPLHRLFGRHQRGPEESFAAKMLTVLGVAISVVLLFA
jgi:hypothetical protein